VCEALGKPFMHHYLFRKDLGMSPLLVSYVLCVTLCIGAHDLSLCETFIESNTFVIMHILIMFTNYHHRLTSIYHVSFDITNTGFHTGMAGTSCQSFLHLHQNGKEMFLNRKISNTECLHHCLLVGN